MLLMIKGTLDPKTIQYETLSLDIPKLYLDDFDYKIAVHYVYLESKANLPPQTIFLSTNAIDRNPFNLNQEIFAFESNGSNYIFGETKTLREYKIQLKEFHTSEFYLHFPIPLQEKIIVKILLEITRDDRIQ